MIKRDSRLFGVSVLAAALVLVVLFIALSVLANLAWGDPLAQNGGRAKPIMDALDRYKTEHKEFPPTLDALVPGYLASLPTAADGSAFSYSTDTDHGYILSFTMSDGTSCGYIEEYRRWECGKGAE